MDFELLKLLAFTFTVGNSIRESILTTYRLFISPVDNYTSLLDFQADFLKVENINRFQNLISKEAKQRFDGELVQALINKYTKETKFKNVDIKFKTLNFFKILSNHKEDDILIALQKL